MLLVRRFAFFALEDQRASYMTCGTGPTCHRMDTPVCIGGDFSRRFEAGAGESAFKEGFIPRVAAMPCFSPTRGVLSPPSSLCPFAFKVSALRCRSLPWPCDFIPSAPRLSECSKWYTACLDGMRRYLPGGLVLGSLLSTTFLPKSLCSLFPNSQRVGPVDPIFLRVAVGGAWPPGLYPWCPVSSSRRPSSPTSAGCPWRRCSFLLLPPAFGGKDDYQPRGGGQRAEPRLHPMRLPVSWGGKRAMLRLHLFGFDGFGAASAAVSRR